MASWMPHYLKPSDGKHLNFEGNRKFMKCIKSKIYSDLRRDCMRDIKQSMGSTVMGLVESTNVGPSFGVSEIFL